MLASRPCDDGGPGQVPTLSLDQVDTIHGHTQRIRRIAALPLRGSTARDDGLADVGNHLARVAPAWPGSYDRALRAATGIRFGAGWSRRRLVSRRSGPSRARAPLRGPPGPARRTHGRLQYADGSWLELPGQRPGRPHRRRGASRAKRSWGSPGATARGCGPSG
jgi:hypothetical protein